MSNYIVRRRIKHTHSHPRNCYILINIIFRNDLEMFISGITLEVITLCQNFHYVKSLTHTLSPDFLPYNFAKNEFHALQETAQGTLLSVMWQPWMGREFGEALNIYTSIAESLCRPPETITTLLISCTPIQNKG